MTTPRQPTDEESIAMGVWAMWAFRQPNALELFQEKWARCEHGIMCQVCIEEARAEVSRITSGQGKVEG